MTKEELYRELVKQKMEMTPGERMKAYMAGEEVDCIPHRLLSADDALGVAWGYSKHDLYNNLDVRAAQLRKKQELYGDASIPFKLGLRGMGIALGSEEIVSDRGENDIGRRFLDTYDKLYILEEFEVESNPWMQKKIETVQEMKQRLPELKYSGGMAGPITTAIAMRPIEYVLRDMRKAPKELHRLLELIVVCNLKYVRAGYEKLGITSWTISDPVTTTDILGVRYFREFSSPYLKKLHDGIVYITGSEPTIHICGHSKLIWEDLADCGFTMLSVDNCENMLDFQRIVGDRMFLTGNVPPVDVMRNGTIDDVIEAVKGSLRTGAENPKGFMLNTGCQVSMGVPLENMDAFFYAARKYGAGAQIGQMPKGMSAVL